jgi:hypothetical protein
MLRRGALLSLAAFLAACGNPTAPVAEAPSPVASTQRAATAIPQGVTAEGYHVLGRSDARVTIEDFSDFL